MFAKRIEEVPDVDLDQVGFAERTGFFEGIKGEIDFEESLVSDDESNLGDVSRFGEFFELSQAYASFLGLTGPSVSMNKK